MTNFLPLLLPLWFVSLTLAQSVPDALVDDRIELRGSDHTAAITARTFSFCLTGHEGLDLIATSVTRGERSLVELPSEARPERQGLQVVRAHEEGIRERFEERVDGVEISWWFRDRPAGNGDLRVRYAVCGVDGALGDDRGVRFTLPSGQVVHVGAVTGVDADGNRCRGGLRLVDGELEMSLPDAFVQSAAYPMVLDPVVGAPFQIDSAGGSSLRSPDAAYDASLDRYMVVHLRRYAGSDIRVRAALIYPNGAGSPVNVSSQGVGIDPQIANYGAGDRWGAVWIEANHNQTRVRFEVLTTSITYYPLTIAVGAPVSFASADIGAEVDAPLGSGRAFVVVYEDNQVNEIRARAIGFDANNAQILSPPVTLWSDGAFETFHEPAITRAAGADGRFVVVARRDSVLGGGASIVGRVVSSDLAILGPPRSVFAEPGRAPRAPDVDGYAGKGVAACEYTAIATGHHGVWFATVAVGADGQSLQVGGQQTIGGTAALQADRVAVGYAPGKSWLGYRFDQPGGVPSQGLKTVGVDGASCGDCGDPVTVGMTQTSFDDLQVCVATATSGGAVSRDGALGVTRNHFTYARHLDGTFNGGGIANLGGGCGGGGVTSFSANPSIGRNRFACVVAGLSPSVLLTIFNFAPLSPSPIPCGACVWTPFSSTQTPAIAAGAAEVAFAIPCQPALIGSAFETQWTSFDPLAAPCPLLPGFVLSDRSLLTIGQ